MKRPRVVFLCVHNAGRSQMAAAFAEREGSVDVFSGGSEPAESVNPVVVEAMREVDIDLAGRRPARFSEDDLRGADVIVTMGCGEACPRVPGARHEDWPVEDPAGKGLADVRRIRDDVLRRVRELLGAMPRRS